MAQTAPVHLDVHWRKTGFLARSAGGGEVVMGRVDQVRGLAPMEMLLASVAGCSGVDVVMILEKMRKTLEDFRITIEGERRETHPRVYIRVHLHYHLQGPDLDPQSVERAIRLSLEKYCSAAATVAAYAQVLYSFVIENQEGRFERGPVVMETVGRGAS